MAYLEQSTRTSPTTSASHRPLRYYRDPGLLDSPLGPVMSGHGPHVRHYGNCSRPAELAGVRHPANRRLDFVHRQPSGQGLDALRASCGSFALQRGIYGTGQSYEMLLLRMRTSRS